MNTHTVENATLRVTVDQAVWDRYTARAERVGQIGDRETPEQRRRGLLLSDAMARLANAAEAARLATDGPSEARVAEIARASLIDQWLADPGNCAYDQAELLRRVHGGYRLSAGQQQQWDAARAYADSIVAPQDAGARVRACHELWAQLSENGAHEPDPSAWKRGVHLLALRAGRDAPRVGSDHPVVQQARAVAAQEHADELRYRGRFSSDGWQIEVIGDLPEQVGMCRT